MRHVVLAISSLLILTSCASQTTKSAREQALKKAIQQKIYYFPYDSVWRAAQLALKYPIATNNMDNGVLETEFVRADEGFQSPVETEEPSSGVRYKISMVMVKGKVGGKESVRITINKIIERKRDFFSDPETLPSDGLEEKVIFYRIERELLIEEGLKKASSQ